MIDFTQISPIMICVLSLAALFSLIVTIVALKSQNPKRRDKDEKSL